MFETEIRLKVLQKLYFVATKCFGKASAEIFTRTM